MINFIVENQPGHEMPVTIPDGIALSLMEALKAFELPVLATCGGMALCATCRVKVLTGADQLPAPGDAEQDMLDQLPFNNDIIRLSCQIKVDERIDNCRFALVPD
jgi:ferredoxin